MVKRTSAPSATEQKGIEQTRGGQLKDQIYEICLLAISETNYYLAPVPDFANTRLSGYQHQHRDNSTVIAKFKMNRLAVKNWFTDILTLCAPLYSIVHTCDHVQMYAYMHKYICESI